MKRRFTIRSLRRRKHTETIAVHGGESIDPHSKASAPPLVLSSTFAVDEPLSFSANELDEDSPWIYTRWSNPTVRSLEHKIAMLEGADESNCVTFASGMAASTATLFSFLKQGDHVVAGDVNYPGVAEIFRYTLPKFGIEVTTVDPSNLQNISGAVRIGQTKMVWVETPSNPILRLVDIEKAAEIAHSVDAELVVDSTFSTPMITKPIEFGADFVVHSLSKYMNGHGDAIGGAVIGKNEQRVQLLRSEGAIHHGGVLSPFNAYLIARGLQTLPLRMREHSSNAKRVSEWLSNHPRVEKVFWPHSSEHPQYDIAQKQMRLGSGMVSFRMRDEEDSDALATRMMESLETIHYAVSLGHQRSLIYLLSTEDLAVRSGSSYALEGEGLESYKAFAGDAGVFRFSAGLENPEDLIADLGKVL